MTALTRPVRRETATVYRGRALCVTIRPRVIEIREKARRDTLIVDYATLYEFALKMRWRAAAEEKRAARGTRGRK
jgi:hypothetical protein